MIQLRMFIIATVSVLLHVSLLLCCWLLLVWISSARPWWLGVPLGKISALAPCLRFSAVSP